jgi:hypothetical protein
MIQYIALRKTGEAVTQDSVYGIGSPLSVMLEALPVKNQAFPASKFSGVVAAKPEIVNAVLPNVLGATAQMAFDDMVYAVTKMRSRFKACGRCRS